MLLMVVDLVRRLPHHADWAVDGVCRVTSRGYVTGIWATPGGVLIADEIEQTANTSGHQTKVTKGLG